MFALVGLAFMAGCAPETSPPPRRAPEAALEPRGDWSLELPRLLPGIRACMAQNAQAVAVTKAWPIEYDLTGARLLEADGERVDCVVAGDGSAVLLTEPVRSASLLSGERDPLFTPGGMAPPRTSCLDTMPFDDGSGNEIGWLSYDSCRKPRSGQPSAAVEPSRRVPPRDGAA